MTILLYVLHKKLTINSTDSTNSKLQKKRNNTNPPILFLSFVLNFSDTESKFCIIRTSGSVVSVLTVSYKYE